MSKKGVIFDIQRWSLHDGPGIRTNVFFKGCPLSCLWCSNPESQESCRELAYFKDKCIGCKSCVASCPHQALNMTEEGLAIQYGKCREFCYGKGRDGDVGTGGDAGFSCTMTCYAKALEVMGREVTVEEVLKEVLSDEAIYKSSGGGLTVSGGEPLAQPEFLRELLKAAKERGLHTAMETCLYAAWEQIEPCLPYLDFLFMDLKILNGERHFLYTRADNRLILENMEKVNEFAKSCGRDRRLQTVIRTPVIPGVNDSREEILSIADWILEHLTEVSVYQLLPYHRLGRGKYGAIGKEYGLAEAEAPGRAEMELMEAEIRQRGLRTRYE